MSYRAYVPALWVGKPLYPPSGAARARGGAQTTVYASWNGATQVSAWRVLAGQSATSLTPVATRAKSGFETAVAVPQGYKTFEVEALNANGGTIGTSQDFVAQGSRAPTPP